MTHTGAMVNVAPIMVNVALIPICNVSRGTLATA